MSTFSEEDHLYPNPTSHTPRLVREATDSRLIVFNDTKRASPSSFDVLLKEAIDKSLRNPFDPKPVHGFSGYLNRLGLWKEIIPAAGQFAAAVGFSALVALLFVILIPGSRDHVQDSATSSVSEPLKTAFDKQALRERDSRPAIETRPSVEASLAADRAAQPAEPAVTHEQSEALLQQFLQWQQKTDSTDTTLNN